MKRRSWVFKLKAFGQLSVDPVRIRLIVLPYKWHFSTVGVRNIEHVMEPRTAAFAVDEGNTPGAAVDIPVHFVVPEIKARHCHGVRLLSKDKQAVPEAVFIQMSGRPQVFKPAVTPRQFAQCFAEQFLDITVFLSHRYPPYDYSSQKKDRGHGIVPAALTNMYTSPYLLISSSLSRGGAAFSSAASISFLPRCAFQSS